MIFDLYNFEDTPLRRTWKLGKKHLLALGLILFSSPLLAAGGLGIQFSENSLTILPSNAIRVPIAEILFTAEREPVEINGIEMIREGLSANNNFGSVWAVADNFQTSLRTNFQFDDTAQMSFRTPIVILPGETRSIMVFVNVKNMQYGRTARFLLNGLWTNAEDIWVE